MLPDRELACVPIGSELGRRYLGAMRAATNCALANREILGHYVRRVFLHFVPQADLRMLFADRGDDKDFSAMRINFRLPLR